MSPRRATSTSFGGDKGNQPGRKKGDPTNIGAMPEIFKRRMQILAQRAAEAKRLEVMLSDDNSSDDIWLKAFDRVCDRGFGQPAKSVDLTSQGEKIAGVVVMPPEE